MTRETLADRVITYCDALAAFSLVNAFAFLVTLAEPGIRCSIARIPTFVIGANLVIPLLITACLILLRRFECSLRESGSQDPAVQKFWSYVQVFRLALVWVVTVLVIFVVWAAAQDLACAEAAA